MPNSKLYTESQFLSGIICGQYVNKNYSFYKKDFTQTYALKALKIFYLNIEKYYLDLDLDLSINSAVSAVLKRTKFFKDKEIKTYCYIFIYSFLKKYPPYKYIPILVDLKNIYSHSNIDISFNYDIFLKEIDSLNYFVFDFFHFNDNHIQNNLDYFYCKYYLFLNKLFNDLNISDITYNLFYFPKLEPLAKVRRKDILFLPLSKDKIQNRHNMFFYFQIFLNKIKVKYNPFCVNFTCPIRKDCLND